MARKRGVSTGRKRQTRIRVSQFDKELDIIVLFADVVGCSEISNHKSIKDYYDFITTFQDCFKKVCEFYRKATYGSGEYQLFDYGARGDEGCLKIVVNGTADLLARYIDVTISIALDLKKMWLFTKHNRERILDDGLLPIDLAIGIHWGKVYVKNGQPEGYAINLAKRVESASRDGKFYHILVSECAHGQLYYLRDEHVYKFDTPCTITTKGISHSIKACEIKHNFLPTDWYEVVSDEPEEISMVYPELTSSDILKISKTAYEINPTNLWLAEQYLTLSIMDAYRRLKREKKVDVLASRKKAYAQALDLAQRIATSDLRDSSALAVWGGLLGEIDRFQEEEDKYREAINLEDTDGDLHWYLGLCISYQLYANQKEYANVQDFYSKHSKHRERIQEVLVEYRRALDLNPMCPWIAYDYACELAWWSQVNKDFRTEAVEMLINAFRLNPDLTDWCKDEEYLRPIIDDPNLDKFVK